MSPIIFMLIMEYLSCTLKVAASQTEFHYHHGCKEIKRCSLSFVDDLLLSCKADGSSVRRLMAALGHFTVVAGLEINPAKFHLVLAGISEQTSGHLQSLTGFHEGTLPFNYLGPQSSLKNC